MNILANDRQSRTPHPGDIAQPRNLPAQQDAPDGRDLLARILDMPHLAQVVPQLQPELLHRVIQRFGLEDCGEILALTTPEQLARVFDLDLWSAAKAGLDEQFDAARFGAWIEVLLENGVATATQKLAGLDIEFVIAGLAQHALVYDRAAIMPDQTLDGEQMDMSRESDDQLTSDIGSYVLVARRTDSWDAIVEVLMFLGEEHPEHFNRVMRGCCTLSNSGFEDDGLDDLLFDRDQVMFDLAVDREQRRENQGYVSPAQARAFLQMARELRLDGDARPSTNPIARAYFRAINKTPPTAANSTSRPVELLVAGSEEQPAPERATESVAAVFKLLFDEGIISPPPQALLARSTESVPLLSEIKTRLEFVFDHDDATYLVRQEELAYLANVLMAGCSIQERPFTLQEASDAVVATCNLGLENWPPQWLQSDSKALPINFLMDHGLVSVFQVGWKILYDNVSMYTAKELIGILKRIQCDDREIQMDIDTLRINLAKHWRAGAPWHARGALEVIAILDTPSWAALLALIDECPTLHATIGASKDSRMLSVSASDFEFISQNGQIGAIREFMQTLHETLTF